MAKKIICLSGWGQKFDSLESIFDPIFFGQNLVKSAADETEGQSFLVKSLDYSQMNSVEEFFEAAAREENPDILVGWSLGGQLALRAIERGIFRPKLLILLAPPFQMVKDSRIRSGMAKKTFDEFYRSFAHAPSQTLQQFAILTAMNDRHAAEIAKTLDINDKNFAQLKFWLKELERFSCFDLDFSKCPRTLFFQGVGDMIVHSSQSEYFAQRIQNFRLEIFKNCGHAPHLSDIEKLRGIIYDEIAKI